MTGCMATNRKCAEINKQLGSIIVEYPLCRDPLGPFSCNLWMTAKHFLKANMLLIFKFSLPIAVFNQTAGLKLSAFIVLNKFCFLIYYFNVCSAQMTR